ncbi:PREDICTED: uncharacterized protein LOC108559509 [Nicrophorus vespilloides]|uniref:Uncharacterized protein LOC108559509 n=1 Tax=Nicrophorus vespilloides TaxID=110193 RepID=A0ABM1MCK1_NICVS|nr:PREDICTED: uncharacterized protein LOC108559509 [Nicrophorus vespilloides]
MKIEIFSTALGWLLAALLPIFHIFLLWYFWSRYTFPVNTATCTCECWDTIFKGPYEYGISAYKHFYFNSTKSSAKIWLIVSIGLIALYECSKQLCRLFLRGKLRSSMLLLFLSSIFPHYYSWWTYINYINDRFYTQWDHQLFFTISEIVSTAIVIHLSNRHHELTRYKMLIIIIISAVHLISGSIDQFIDNIIMMRGSKHQVVRDLGFVLADVMHIAVPIFELRDLEYYNFDNRVWYKDRRSIIEFTIAGFLILVGCVIVQQL